MKRFLLLLLITPAALGATYNVALPGGGVLTVNGLPYVNPGITNSASVVWGVDGTGLLYATATGTNSSIVYVEGAAVAGPNFGLSTEIDPAVTASTNITFSLVNSSITTNKIDSTFYSLLMQTGAGDVTQAGNNTFTGTNIFQSSTTISNLAVDALEANSLTLNTPIGVTAVGTNAADARTQLGVAYDVDVQAYRLQLLQAALALTADGHMIYHNGTLVTNLTSTSPGRYLLTAATATDQRNSLVVGELDQTVYSAAWDGVTNKTPTLDAIYNWGQALPGGSNAITTWNTNYFSVSGGYLDWVGGDTGGGAGGYTYLLTNSVGAFQSRTASTNWIVMSTTVSSNYAPSATGKFLEGGYGLVLSNNSGTIGNLTMRIKANGTTVFQDVPAAITTGTLRAAAEDFRIVRESDTTASIVSVGAYVNPAASIGLGDFGGGSPLGNAKVTTNVAWNWATNNTLEISVDCDTATSTNDALGMTVIQAFLRAEGAAGSGTGDVVGPASATSGNIATYSGTTGKLIQDGGTSVSSLATEAEVAAGYQPLDADLTTLATLNGSALTNLNASSIASGTVASNLLPAAVSFTTLNAGTINATAVVGDASGLTGINATNITAGTLPDARLSANVGLTNAVVLKAGDTMTGDLSVPDEAYGAGWDTSVEVPTKNAVYDQVQLRAPLASPALTGTPTVNGTNLMAAIASAGGGGGGLTLIDAAPITNVNFRSSWANKASVSSVTNVDWIPQPPTTASSASLTPAFNSSRGHEFTLTNNAILNAPSGVTSDMVGDTFRLVFIQDATGGRTLTAATNYLFGSDITGLTLTTNAGARDYMVLYVRRTDVFDVIGFVRGYAQ